MKKILALLILAAMTFSFIACGEGPGSEKQSESQKASESEKQSEKQSETEEELPEEYTGEGDDIVYVNPNYDGVSNGSSEQPYKTIKEAVDYVMSVILDDGVQCDYVIYLCKGTHVIDETISLELTKAQRTQYGDSTISFVGSPKGTVVTSNYEIDGAEFELVRGKNYYRYQLPEDLKDDNGHYPIVDTLIQNDLSLRPSSSTRVGDSFHLPFDPCRYITTFNANRGVSADNGIIYVDKYFASMFATNEEGQFIDEKGQVITRWLWVKDEWEIHKIHATGIKLSDTIDCSTEDVVDTTKLAEVKIDPQDWEMFKGKTSTGSLNGREYWFEGDLRCLDDPGEFYYDDANGILYTTGTDEYYMEESTIGFPRLDILVKMGKMSNVSFANIEFVGTSWKFDYSHSYITGQAGVDKILYEAFPPYAIILGVDCHNVKIDGCTIRNAGLDAIYFYGDTQGIQVVNNTILHTAGTAIRFGENTHTYIEGNTCNIDILVDNNYIFDTATRYQLCPAIVVSSVKNIKISHNSIIKTNYTGISIGWNWVLCGVDSASFVNIRNAEIAYNYIEEYMMALQDGGAIYTLGGNSMQKVKDRFNEIHHNVIIETKGIGGNEFGHYLTIYHDGSSSHWHDYENMVIRDYENLKPEPTFVYYYQAVSGQQAYSCDMSSSYTIGLADKYRLHLISGAGRYADVKLSMNDDGSFDVVGPSLSDFELTFQNAYCFADFEAAKANMALYDIMENLYNMSGSTMGEKPFEFGVLPTYD